MKTEILNLKLIEKDEIPVEMELSFEPFLSHLEQLSVRDSVKTAIYQSVISRFRTDLGDVADLDLEDTRYHQELLDMIYMVLTPIIPTEKRHLWALSTAVPSKVFYSTNAFYIFHSCESSCAFAGISDLNKEFVSRRKAFLYRYLLKRFYNVESPVDVDSFIQGIDPETGRVLYYKIHVDTRFVEAETTDTLPQLSDDVLENWLLEPNGVEYLEEVIPLSLFKFRGFTVLDFVDVTEEYAIEKLKNILVDHSEGVPFEEINESLKILSGRDEIEFGMLPLVKLNGRSVYLKENCSRSVIMNAAIKYHISEDVFHELVQEYEGNTAILVFNNISEQKQINHPFLKVIKYAGVNSYALLPVLYRGQLLGILEVYSKEKVFLDRSLLSRFQTVMPYLAQLLKQLSEEFSDSIDQIVRDNFTSLKSSVKWKFNEVAWNYLQDSFGSHAPRLGKVAFNGVYPFYGAIDVRQSTHERNQAAFADISAQLNLLEQTLVSLADLLDGDLKTRLSESLPAWQSHFEAYRQKRDEMSLLHLFEREVDVFLEEVKTVSEETQALTDAYFSACSETDGIAYLNRRELEVSLQSINYQINKYLLNSQVSLQKVFPHYFEKFRSDGFEYDIYLGESIAPHKEFSDNYIRQMRLWQLRSMAEIAVITRNLKHTLPRPLQTTQLIFVHSTPITISFRNDEKRFDVEGGYSIRYEVIKKRIDKVRIKETHERLTQPDKIALVYFSALECDEYLGYIKTLQAEGVLEDDLELLDLEELQGVNSLKALRVGVK